MQNTHTLCYISNSRPDIKEAEIEDLFFTSSTKNNEYGVTGILLHEMGRFFQVLEGREKVICKLYEKIRTDSRHDNLYLVYNQATRASTFKDYNSKFNIIKSYEDLEAIKSYLDQNTLNSTRDKISRLLAPFLIMKQ